MANSFDLLLTGVGGQGTILASRLLAEAALQKGYFVRTSETIGMAQRGGSVTSHLRLHSQEKSPLISMGAADVLIGFEPAEALRTLPLVKAGGRLVVNTKEIKAIYNPKAPNAYDKDAILAYLAHRGAILVDAYGLALGLGSIKALNVVLLGVAFGADLIPLGQAQILAAMEGLLPAKHLALNRRAFELGVAWGIQADCEGAASED